LKKKNLDKKLKKIKMLAQRSDSESVDLLIDMLKDRRPDVWRTAAEAWERSAIPKPWIHLFSCFRMLHTATTVCASLRQKHWERSVIPKPWVH
jgi:hypothetical protein